MMKYLYNIYYTTIKTYKYDVMLNKKAGYEVVHRLWIQLWERKYAGKPLEGIGKILSDCLWIVEL